MDFTPGGFVNRAPKDFKVTSPAEVMGTRARQLAMTVVYPSPLTVLCDSPKNYRGQPGIEFLRDIPTVWDETVVLSGEVGESIGIARRSGNRWYLVAMNGEASTTLPLPLNFLGKGKWTMRSYADRIDGEPSEVVESNQPVEAATVLPLKLAGAGGFSAVLSQANSGR